MLFTDEETRHEFHKAPTLLQVICQLFESEVSKAHMQMELVDFEQQGDFWVALLIVAHDDYETNPELQAAFKHAIESVNRQFRRTDNVATAELEQGNFGLCTVRVTSAKDFAQLQ